MHMEDHMDGVIFFIITIKYFIDNIHCGIKNLPNLYGRPDDQCAVFR